jgi:hypothetical protein
MKLLKRINNMSILELQNLQEAVLTEIQRRKVIEFGGPGDESADPEPADAAPVAESDGPSTLPLPNRRVSRNPRRLRRAA